MWMRVAIVLYLILFWVAMIRLSPMDSKIYWWTLENCDFFIWVVRHFNHNFSTHTNNLTKFVVSGALFFPLFPIVAWIDPQWDKTLNYEGMHHGMVVSLHRDRWSGETGLVQRMQSKLWWYRCFGAAGIRTPQVYYHYDASQRSLTPVTHVKIDDMPCIVKPEYGTGGSSIQKSTLAAVLSCPPVYPNNMVIQEYIQDGFVDYPRHFRIYTTMLGGNVSVFSIDSRSQLDTGGISSNIAQGGTMQPYHPESLSTEENAMIQEITSQLCQLHRHQFHILPIIGWDVCLTLDGPYVFEGNVGATIPDHMYDAYMEFMRRVYQE